MPSIPSKTTAHLVATAAGGLLMGLSASASGQPPPATEGDHHASTADHADAAPLDSNCCKGTNECKGKGNCKTDAHDCAGKNECKGQGGCKPVECPEEKPDKVPVP